MTASEVAERPLRILVYPHDLNVGGSQINAIDLAAAVRRRGHDVRVVGPAGTLVDRVLSMGLPYRELPAPRLSTTARIIALLRTAVREQDIDVVHPYEGVPIAQCWYGLHLASGTPVVATVNSMSVSDVVPRDVPLFVCTPNIARLSYKHRHVEVCEIPIDLTGERVPTEAVVDFRSRYGLRDDELNVVVVSRVAPELKLQGLLEACAAVGRLVPRIPLRLVVVGDGPSMPALRAAADAAGEHRGRPAVVLTGQLHDPRPAYASADLVLGMGGSALRGMAAGKPVVVQGENGFWLPLSEDHLPMFRHQGYYGIGEGGGVDRLEQLLASLVGDPDQLARMADLGSTVVRRHHDVEAIAEQLVLRYRRVATTTRTAEEVVTALPLAVRSAARVLRRRGQVGYDPNLDEHNSRARIEEGIRSAQDRYGLPAHLTRTS